MNAMKIGANIGLCAIPGLGEANMARLGGLALEHVGKFAARELLESGAKHAMDHFRETNGEPADQQQPAQDYSQLSV